MEQLTEEKLIQQARRGDQDAISQLYESTKNYAWFVARRYLQNDEDIADVLQDAYISAFGKLNTFEDGKSFKTWLHSIVVNKCLNFLRRKKSFHISTGEIAELVNDDEDIIPAAWLERAEKRRDIIRIIDALPEGQRMAISLFYIEGLPLSEMAEVMGISEGAAKSHLYRGRKAIKEAVLLEEKKGNKLYGIVMVPLLTQLFEMEAEAAVMPEEMSKIVWEGTLRGLAAAQSDGSGDGTSGQNVPKSGTGGATPTAAKNVAKAATKMISKKAIIAAVSVVGAAAVITAGIIFLPPLFNAPDNSTPPGVTDNGSTSTPGTTEPSGTETPGTSETPSVPDTPEAPASDFEYEATADGIVITKYIGSSTEVLVPGTIEGKPVVVIDNFAFSERDTLMSIEIPEGVTSIGDCAFRKCKALENIFLPKSVMSIGTQAFDSCSSLKSITIPEGVTGLAPRAFYGCSSLESLTILRSETEMLYGGGWINITSDTFEGCVSLTSITIPDTTALQMNSLGKYLPNTITDVTVIATNVELDSSENVSKSHIFDYFESLENGNVIIPGGVDLHPNMFFNCETLTSVTILDGVTTIGSNAFNGCTSLSSVTIGNSVAEIGEGSFKGCTSLKSVVIPSGVTKIDSTTFAQCTALTNVTIPEGVTEIGNQAFFGCSSLISVSIPNSVKTIGSMAFVYCDSLSEETIGRIKQINPDGL